MPKYTPGPWKSESVDAVPTIVPMREVYGANNSVVARQISLPNDAALIVAAPELYEATVALLEYIRELHEAGKILQTVGIGSPGTVTQMAMRAISKAEGLG